jgi:hypothetical protein
MTMGLYLKVKEFRARVASRRPMKAAKRKAATASRMRKP